MAREEGWDHNEEQARGEGEDDQKSWVYAYKRVNGEERESLRRLPPGKKSNGAVLENESYANPCIEATEVRGHDRQAE